PVPSLPSSCTNVPSTDPVSPSTLNSQQVSPPSSTSITNNNNNNNNNNKRPNSHTVNGAIPGRQSNGYHASQIHSSASSSS
ncbi:unnamed protein product, partial [Rotaria magnacalcarata]